MTEQEGPLPVPLSEMLGASIAQVRLLNPSFWPVA